MWVFPPTWPRSQSNDQEIEHLTVLEQLFRNGKQPHPVYNNRESCYPQWAGKKKRSSATFLSSTETVWRNRIIWVSCYEFPMSHHAIILTLPIAFNETVPVSVTVITIQVVLTIYHVSGIQIYKEWGF